MKKSKPPAEALERRRGSRPAFGDLAAALLADPGTWYDVTSDLPAAVRDREQSRLDELCRAITRGERAAFKPAGQYEAATKDGTVWIRAVKDFTPAEPAPQPEPDTADAELDINDVEEDVDDREPAGV